MSLLLLPSSSSLWLWNMREKISALETKRLRKLLHISYLEHKTNDWVRSKINSLIGAEETLPATVKPCMVQACHTLQQPLQNHPSGHLGGWATPWSAEEMPDGQRQRVDIPCPCQNCSKGLCRKDRKMISAESSLSSTRRPNRSRNWTELNRTETLWANHAHFIRLKATETSLFLANPKKMFM